MMADAMAPLRKGSAEREELLAALQEQGVSVHALRDGTWAFPGFYYFPEEDRCSLGAGVFLLNYSLAAKIQILTLLGTSQGTVTEVACA